MSPYLGMMTITSWPSLRSAAGNAPTTSASPPDLANGTHSGVIIAMLNLDSINTSNKELRIENCE